MTAAPTLRVLVVDDEPLGRARLVDLLSDVEGVDVAGTSATVDEAVAAVGRGALDLVLLDIRMPPGDGFDVIRRVGPERMPPVVFCTAFDEYAVRAFEVHALDYLLKPVDPARLEEAIARVRATGRPDAARAGRLDAVLGDGHVAARTGDGVRRVRVAEIDRVEAAGNYLRVHSAGEQLLLRSTLAALEARLPAAEFARIHRSHLVRVARVREVRPRKEGEFDVVLEDGATLRSGRRYRGRVRDLME